MTEEGVDASHVSDTQAEHPADSLGLGIEEMRPLAHWAVDRVLDHFEHGARGPAINESSSADLLAALGGPPPEEPGDPLEAMETLVDVVLANMQHGDHPRYFARDPRSVVVRRRARRVARHRLQRDRGLVAGRVGAGNRGARRAGLAAAPCSACPREPRACSQRWLARQYHGPDRRAKDGRRRGRVLSEQTHTVARRAVSSRSAFRPSTSACWRATSSSAWMLDSRARRHRRGPCRRPSARVRHRHGRHHQLGRRRSPGRARRLVPPRICGSRRRRIRSPGSPVRCGTDGARRDRASRLARGRPPQVAVSAIRHRVPARSPPRARLSTPST